ncbi:hypothetical protein SD10_06900 [Spirosoma radiotolerans]|uniref:Uncharacterized protein n=1 Tax=Spirosoma radiotolerans TaxID=1379870 RepID=A0A0E3ZUQ4_9BACT|nr:hypothetical protein SD10_06900 [Spirosoma radiotolerans]
MIATKTTKESVSSYQQSQLDLETVTIGNESVQVSTTQKSVYSYDTKGRILTEYNAYSGAKYDSVLYKYTAGAVTIRTINLTDKTFQTEVLKLNKQGLAEKLINGPFPTSYNASYDQDGYLTSLTDYYGVPEKIENGNVIQWVFTLEGPGTGDFPYIYSYDLTKPGLPPIKLFYGKSPRNLRTKYTVQQTDYKQTGPVKYTVTYTYVFDDIGRVKRQIEEEKDSGYIFGGNDGKVTVTDFTYLCP